jgi:RNA polymerase sigma-70 factor, ECF subfamily
MFMKLLKNQRCLANRKGKKNLGDMADRQRVATFPFLVETVSRPLPEHGEEESAILLERVKRGDTNAFQTIFDRYYFRLIGFIRRFVDESDVEDVAQEVLTTVVGKLNSIRDLNAFECYLFRSARNRSINWLRKKHRIQECLKTYWYASNTWQNNNPTGEKDSLYGMETLLNALPALERRYIELFYIHKHSRDEIAVRLNESSSTVYRRLASARALLLKKAQERGLDLHFFGRHDLEIQESKADGKK